MTQLIQIHGGRAAIVDDEDFSRLSSMRWYLNRSGYAMSNYSPDGARRTTLMHRVVLGLGAGEMADHINGDRLDNRRSNLRACAPAENARNRAINRNSSVGVKGVTRCAWRRARQYQAQIQCGGVKKNLGYFPTAEEAGAAYALAARELFGSFARTEP